MLIFLLFILFPVSTLDAQGFNAVILMYHKFGENKYPSTSVRLEQFEKQLDYMHTNGYTVLPLEKIAAAYRNRTDLPDKSIAITVDDAYASVYAEAYPRLKKMNWPFTVFVSTDSVDQHFKAMMTWDQMREMKENGVLFANHTSTHDYLVRRKKGETADEHLERVKNDIEHAQRRLMEELGSAPMLFSYPYGEFNTPIAEYLKSAGYLAFGQHSGAMGLHNNPVALPRFPVNEHYGDIKNLKAKFRSLAMPVTSLAPFEPVTTDRQPILEVSLEKVDAWLGEMTCFISGQGRTMPKWVEKGKYFTVQATRPLPNGRSRYTCTAPNKQRDRYYWFSHQWVVKEPL